MQVISFVKQWKRLPQMSSFFNRGRQEKTWQSDNRRRIPCGHLLTVEMLSGFMGPTWGPPGDDRTQVGPMLAIWTLLSGLSHLVSFRSHITHPTTSCVGAGGRLPNVPVFLMSLLRGTIKIVISLRLLKSDNANFRLADDFCVQTRIVYIEKRNVRIKIR